MVLEVIKAPLAVAARAAAWSTRHDADEEARWRLAAASPHTNTWWSDAARVGRAPLFVVATDCYRELTHASAASDLLKLEL